MLHLSNPHTHSVFCDGKDTVEHMAERAYDFGLVSLGFSGHGPQTNNSFGIQSETEYAAEVRRVAGLFEGRMKIWLGIEQDYFGYCTIPYDYRLGAVHYLDGFDGVNHAVDHSEECFERMLREGFGGDALAMARAYYAREVAMCEKIRPDVVVHYDLLCKFNENNRFFDERDPAYLKLSLEALEAIYDGKRLLEVNTGAIARGRRTRPYPDLCQLKRWRELGGGVILGSDCHDAEKLTCGFDGAIQLIKEAGFKTIWRLGVKDELFVEETI
ncbi:MAG: histidinol phosphate phosphatase [Clostridia bacterium]|nr:histidinol phosphate phosphatase [Clostridia bacterium]